MIETLALVGIAVVAAVIFKKRKRLQPVSVTLDGDSIVWGLGIKHSVGARLKQWQPGWVVDDRGVVGLTLSALIDGYDKPYADAPPEHFPRGPQPAYVQVGRSTHYVLVEAGGNDALELRPPEVFEAQMRSAITTIQSEGRVPVLTGIIDMPVGGHPFVTAEAKQHRDALNAITLSLAAEYGLKHAGWGEDYRGPQDVTDGIHRTQEASDRLARLLIAAISK